MVSTRQMSTAVLSHGGSNEDASIPNTRLSVITRQSSSAALVVSSSSKSTATTANSKSNDDANLKNAAQLSQQHKINLLDLPIEILDHIFSYVGYKKVGQMRMVSRHMNQVCSAILNSTFSKLQTQMLNRFQTVKAMMPRRESARRNHPLACECDIIETCHMRLSLLHMTFVKHIERKHCCFFPGAILDEVYYVLNYIRTTPKLERPYKVTDELFDLSTMAMEYFKEHIEPNLPKIVYFSKDFFNMTSESKQSFKTVTESTEDSSSMPSPPQSNMVLRKGIRKIKQGMKMYNNQLTALRSELRTCKRKSSEQGKQIAEQQKLLADQQKQTLEYANRLDENDRKNEEMSRKFSTLLQELNKCKTELQYWRSKSPAVQVCTSCGHKIPPAVAPEEYQALVNQGVKPQDININLEDVDDSDTSSNIFSDLGLDNQSGSEFIFPDEATTAKLLASSAATGSKRRHDGTIGSTSLNTSIFGIDNVITFINNTETNNKGKNGNLKPPNYAAGSGGGGGGGDGSNSENCTGVTVNNTSINTFNDGNLAATSLPPSSNSLSSDTKKARKVQNKGSRCHNTNSKRNK